MKDCENCIEWEYFEGYGHGCFCMQTMTPLDAEKCEFYDPKDKNQHDSLLDKLRRLKNE